MGYSRSWEASSYLATQKLPRILSNLMVGMHLLSPVRTTFSSHLILDFITGRVGYSVRSTNYQVHPAVFFFFFAVSCYLVVLSPKKSSSAPCIRTLSACILPPVWDHVSGHMTQEPLAVLIFLVYRLVDKRFLTDCQRSLPDFSQLLIFFCERCFDLLVAFPKIRTSQVYL